MIELVECTLQSRRICVASDIAMFQQEKAMMFIHLPDLLKLLSRLGERQDKVTHQGAVGGAACLIVGPPEGSFYVSCKNASMYGKKMRDVHIAGYSVQSDVVIRFRTRDGKVAVADLLVGVGKYVSVSKAQETMMKFIQSKDERIRGLDIEVDTKYTDEVLFNFNIYWYKTIFKISTNLVPLIFSTRSHTGQGTNLVPPILLVLNQIRSNLNRANLSS